MPVTDNVVEPMVTSTKRTVAL